MLRRMLGGGADHDSGADPDSATPSWADLFAVGNWDAAQERIRLHPEEAQVKDSTGQLPLRLAIECDAPGPFINALEAAFPLEQWSLLDALKVCSGGTAQSRQESAGGDGEGTDMFGPVPLEFVQKTLKLITPASCAEEDANGSLVLHSIMNYKHMPSELTLAVMEANPSACKQRVRAGHSAGDLPLELAIRFGLSVKVIEAMVKRELQEIDTTTKSGVTFRSLLLNSRFAEHRDLAVAWTDADMSIPDPTDERWAEASSKDNQLHKALRCSDWDDARERLAAHPEEAAELDPFGRLPLQEALRDPSTPAELTVEIIKANPAACRTKDKDGDVALVVAVVGPVGLRGQIGGPKSLPAAVVDAVENAYPLELWCTSLHDAIPLAKGSSKLLKKILAMVTTESCAQQEGFPDGTGSMSTKLRQFKSWRQCAWRLPLHVALRDKTTPPQLTLAILAAHPDAQDVSELDEQQAFDLAVHHEQPTSVITAMLESRLEGIDGATNNSGATYRNILLGSKSEAHRQLAETWNCELGVYDVENGEPVHLSATAVARYARDVLRKRRVCLKYMKNLQQFEAEVNRRFDKHGKRLPAEAVIEILAWHMPAGESLVDADGVAQQPECTVTGAEYPYVLVLERGERSLHEACARERIAGYAAEQIVFIFRSLLQCVHTLHLAGIVHGDIKQRNVLRLNSRTEATQRWIMCDMDASAFVGDQIGRKTSSAYAPPELARRRYSGNSDSLQSAETSFDVWSLGVVLFELCTGHSLFAQDTSNDELIEEVDQTRLCTWDTIADDDLQHVLKEAVNATPQMVNDAQNLIRWCLKGNPDERPNVMQMLQHHLLDPSADAPQPMPMRFAAFMSHCQADSSGVVGTLFHEYRKLGLHCWLDMKQEQLTLEGMRRGVRASAVFLLILSERVLASWFCQQELLMAIEEGKPIQLIVEQEPRFHPFDRTAWERSKGRSERVIKGGNGDDQQSELVLQVVMDDEVPWQSSRGNEQLCKVIADTIDDCLASAVTYRRRDFEQEAMMREVCRRNGIVLPALPVQRRPASQPPVRVAAICNPETSADMLDDLKMALQSTERVEVTQNLHSADRVLLLLTAGVLKQTASVEHLEQTIERDKAAHTDRIVAIFNEETWRFGNQEHKSAPARVQECINDHEALTYRPRDPCGPDCHEHPAMIAHLLRMLGVIASETSLPTYSEEVVTPVATVREQLETSQQQLAACKQERMAAILEAKAAVSRERALAAQNAALLARLAAFEAVPPEPEIETILVKDRHGEEIATVLRSDSVSNVKAKVQKMTGIDPSRQRIVYAGMQLKDGKRLSDYNLSLEEREWLTLIAN